MYVKEIRRWISLHNTIVKISNSLHYFLSVFSVFCLLISFHFSMHMMGPILFCKLDMNGFTPVERGSFGLGSFILCC